MPGLHWFGTKAWQEEIYLAHHSEVGATLNCLKMLITFPLIKVFVCIVGFQKFFTHGHKFFWELLLLNCEFLEIIWTISKIHLLRNVTNQYVKQKWGITNNDCGVLCGIWQHCHHWGMTCHCCVRQLELVCFWSQECFVGSVLCLLEIQKEKKLALIFQQDCLEKVGSNKHARMFNQKMKSWNWNNLVAKSCLCRVLIS